MITIDMSFRRFAHLPQWAVLHHQRYGQRCCHRQLRRKIQKCVVVPLVSLLEPEWAVPGRGA